MSEFNYFNDKPFDEYPDAGGVQPDEGEQEYTNTPNDGYQDPSFYPEDVTGIIPDQQYSEIEMLPLPERYDFDQFIGEHSNEQDPNYEKIEAIILKAYEKLLEIPTGTAVTSEDLTKPGMYFIARKPDQFIKISASSDKTVTVIFFNEGASTISSHIYKIHSHKSDKDSRAPEAPTDRAVTKDREIWDNRVPMPKPGEVPDRTREKIAAERYRFMVDSGLRQRFLPVGFREAVHLSQLLGEARLETPSFLRLTERVTARSKSLLDVDINGSQVAGHKFSELVDRRLANKGISTDEALLFHDMDERLDDEAYLRIETGYEQGTTRSLPHINYGRQRPQQDNEPGVDIPATPYLQVSYERPTVHCRVIEILSSKPDVAAPLETHKKYVFTLRYGIDPALGTLLVIDERSLRNSDNQDWTYDRRRTVLEESDAKDLLQFLYDPHYR
jgi:hypothetical protein